MCQRELPVAFKTSLVDYDFVKIVKIKPGPHTILILKLYKARNCAMLRKSIQDKSAVLL